MFYRSEKIPNFVILIIINNNHYSLEVLMFEIKTNYHHKIQHYYDLFYLFMYFMHLFNNSIFMI